MRPITFAHRGGAADYPDNSIEGFAAARARGATGVESDVRLSSDGVAVLAHDGLIRQGLRRVRVDATPVGVLRATGVATLDDLYDAVGTDMHISLDLKVAGAADPVIEASRSRGAMALDRLWLCSPDLAHLEEIRAREPAVRLVHSVRYRDIAGTMEHHAARLAEARIDAFNMPRTDWSRGLVILFHRFEVRAFAWGVNELRHLRHVLTMGVDALYSDYVDRMVAAVAEFADP